MKQLNFMDLPEVELPPAPKLQKVIDQNRAEIKAQTDFVRSFDIEAPVMYGPDFWEDIVTRAVLKVNNWQREIEADGGDASSFIRAQDWLCLELPEWCHDILREW